MKSRSSANRSGEALLRLDLSIDVSDAAGLGEEAAIALTVEIPPADLLGAPPIVCFAKPGAGFSRRYFTTDLPGPGSGSQSSWHTGRGWVFVSVDPLGVGGSSTHHDPERLDHAVLAAASRAAEREVLEGLANATLHESLPPVRDPVVLGVGQSMGGCLTVSQQGRYHDYDGIGVLGFSAVHTHPPVPPGATPWVHPWRLRDGGDAAILNAARVAAAQRNLESTDFAAATDWLFYFDDVDLETVRVTGAPWISVTYPMGVIATVLTPGVVAAEAAAVDVPVLVAMGERDVIADPRGEACAYRSASSIDLYVCPQMAHMHNFASTRELLWQRIETWGAWVAALTLASRSGVAKTAR